MGLPKFEYVAPKTVARAVAVQKEGGGFLAGGTDLFVAMKQRMIHPGILIDLSAISTLKKIRGDKKGGVRIGAMTTLTRIRESPIVQKQLPALGEIILSVSTPQLRNMGTIGGNLCLDTRCLYYNQPLILKKRWEPCLKIGGEVCHVVRGRNSCYSVYSGDMAAPLMALGAKVKIVGSTGTKKLALIDFFTGSGIKPNILEDNEILTEIIIPPMPKYSGLSYQKLRLRDTMDFPLLGVAVRVERDGVEGRCLDFRLSMGAVAPGPFALEEAEDIMRGKTITPERIEEVSRIAGKHAHPVANTAAEPRYRKQMVPILTKNAIREALDRIKKAPDL